jgi:hypothetical protein
MRTVSPFRFSGPWRARYNRATFLKAPVPTFPGVVGVYNYSSKSLPIAKIHRTAAVSSRPAAAASLANNAPSLLKAALYTDVLWVVLRTHPRSVLGRRQGNRGLADILTNAALGVGDKIEHYARAFARELLLRLV